MKKKIKLTPEEKELLESVEAGEWNSVANLKEEKAKAKQAARNTLRKDSRINIRIQSADLEKIKKIAEYEGLPYQTLVSSILHKFAEGRLK